MDKNKRHPSKESKSINNDRQDRRGPTKQDNSDELANHSLDWTSKLADEWEISENSMLIPETTNPNYLSQREMDSIIDESPENPINTTCKKIANDSPAIKLKEKLDKEALSQTTPPKNIYISTPLTPVKPVKENSEPAKVCDQVVNTASRKAAENLITSLTESISGTKTPQVENNLEFESTRSAQKSKAKKGELVPSETADFPTSNNPFKQATNNALIDIAKSKNTSEATLLWLSENTDPTIRRAVARNPLSSKQVLARLIKDFDGQVRLSALDNPSLTSDFVVDLLNDTNPLVSLRAYEVLNEIRKKAGLKPIANKSQLNTVNDMPAIRTQNAGNSTSQEKPTTASSTEEVIAFLRMIAQKHSTPTQRLSELANHKDPQVRAAVAKNARSPIDVLWSLLHDSETLVKQNLIRNECSPVELLWALKDDPDKLVSQEAHRELKKLDNGQ